MSRITIIAGENTYVNDRAVELQRNGFDVDIFRTQPASIPLAQQASYYAKMRDFALGSDQIHTDISRMAEEFEDPAIRSGAHYIVELFYSDRSTPGVQP